MRFIRNREDIKTAPQTIQSIIEELSKVETDLPLKLKTHQNLRAIQSAKGILRSLSFRL